MGSRNGVKLVRVLTSGIFVCVGVATVLSLARSQEQVKATSSYVGWEFCRGCHKDKAEKYATSPHSSTLKVAGLSQEFSGCEACHGPGSDHVKGDRKAIVNPGKVRGSSEKSSLCLKCHAIDAESQAPKEWQKLDTRYWSRSPHAKQDNGCLSCHSEHAGKKKLLVRDEDKLCVECHPIAKPKEGEKIHVPYEQGDCVMCHEPHGSNVSPSLKSNIQEVCVTCHDAKSIKEKHPGIDWPIEKANCVRCHKGHLWETSSKALKNVQHKPFEQRKCNLCHAPTTNDNPFPLVKPAKELCTMCHSTKSLLANAGDSDDKKKGSAHPPVKEGFCLSCHEPHASNYAHLFKTASPSQTCLNCHNKIDAAMQLPYKHKPVAGGNCLICHDGHASKERKLLVKETSQVCKMCHQHEHAISHPYGEWGEGRNRRTIKDPRTGERMTCANCHNIHGSKFINIAQAEPDRDLCLLCHSEAMGLKIHG